MNKSIIDRARDLAEGYVGLARIGASLAADRVREAVGVRRARVSVLCGRCGIDPSVCTDDEDEPICGDCAWVRFGDLARRLDTAAFHTMEARRERDAAREELARMERYAKIAPAADVEVEE